METGSSDALLNLRYAIALNTPPVITASSDPPKPEDAVDISTATHIHFSIPQGYRTISLDTPTRFVDGGNTYDLRSIFVAWQNRNLNVGDYLSTVQQLNETLAHPVSNLPYGARLDLANWLQDPEWESEYIQPLEEKAAAAELAANIAAGAKVDILPTHVDGIKGVRNVDARLQEIYRGERRIGDRNTALRGSKPTVSRLRLSPQFVY